MIPSEPAKGFIDYNLKRNDEEQKIHLHIELSGFLYDLFPVQIPKGADETLIMALLQWLASISGYIPTDSTEIQ